MLVIITPMINLLNSDIDIEKLIEILPMPIAMISFGVISFMVMSVILIYMKNKVGLNPKMYSELELKYDNENKN